ncbi:MAG: autotransporter outer membrane beta-barrel domain-containing protein [Granulosicoccus sp.]
MLNSGESIAGCPAVAFPDNSNLGPLPPLSSDLSTINIASAAGLRTLEYGTNFQRRSANLIGQNPLIVASNDDKQRSGAAAGDDDDIGSKLGVLISAFGAFGNEKSDNLGTDIDWDTTATALSVDYALSPSLFVGAMIGTSSVSGCSSPQDNFTTSGSVNVVSNDVEGSFDVLSLYGIRESDTFYLDSIVSFGSGDFDFRRAQTVNGLLNEDNFIILDRVDEVIVADTSSDLFRASFAAGIKRQYRQIELSPYSRLSYALVSIDGYREQLDLGSSPGHPAPGSGGGFALRLSDQDVESLTTGLGFGSTYVLSTSAAVISLNGDFEWVHEFKDTSNSLRSSLAGFSQGTISNAAVAQRFPERRLDSDYFYLGVGANAVLQNGWQLFANIQSLLGYQNVSETHLGAGVRYEF